METLRQSKQSGLSRLGLILLRFIVKVVPVLSAICTFFGILLSASTYEPRLAKYILSHYPRYRLAQQGLSVLKDRKYPLKDSNGKEILAGVLDIDDPSWPVILEFVKSEIAIRKSERNEPGPALSTTLTGEGSPEKPSLADLPPIDFGRIKTIFAVEIGTPKAGSKPLVPPYRLVILWPHSSKVPRYVYEFLSFQEFELDLRQMLVLKIRYVAILASGIAFAATTFLGCLRVALRRFAPGVLATTRSGPTTIVSPKCALGDASTQPKDQ